MEVNETSLPNKEPELFKGVLIVGTKPSFTSIETLVSWVSPESVTYKVITCVFTVKELVEKSHSVLKLPSMFEDQRQVGVELAFVMVELKSIFDSK